MSDSFWTNLHAKALALARAIEDTLVGSGNNIRDVEEVETDIGGILVRVYERGVFIDLVDPIQDTRTSITLGFNPFTVKSFAVITPDESNRIERDNECIIRHRPLHSFPRTELIWKRGFGPNKDMGVMTYLRIEVNDRNWYVFLPNAGRLVLEVPESDYSNRLVLVRSCEDTRNIGIPDSIDIGQTTLCGALIPPRVIENFDCELDQILSKSAFSRLDL